MRATTRVPTPTGKHWHYDLNTTEWTTLSPQSPFYLFIPQNKDLQAEYEQGWRIIDLLPVNSTGVKTHRDHFVIDFDPSSLSKRIRNFRDLSISDMTIVEQYDLQDTRDWKLNARRRSLAANPQWETFFTQCLYRPFDIRAYFHNEDVVELPRHEVMRHMVNKNNLGLLVNRQVRLEHIQHFVIRRDSCPLVETITCPRLRLRGRSKTER